MSFLFRLVVLRHLEELSEGLFHQHGARSVPVYTSNSEHSEHVLNHKETSLSPSLKDNWLKNQNLFESGFPPVKLLGLLVKCLC